MIRSCANGRCRVTLEQRDRRCCGRPKPGALGYSWPQRWLTAALLVVSFADILFQIHNRVDIRDRNLRRIYPLVILPILVLHDKFQSCAADFSQISL